jgi:branched-subunit amino acid ABC-type transport system permease component
MVVTVLCVRTSLDVWASGLFYSASEREFVFFGTLIASLIYEISPLPAIVMTIAMIFVAQLLMTVQHQVGMWLTTEDQRDLEGINPHAPSPPPWEVNVDLDPARLRLDGILTIVVGLSAVAGIAAYLRFSSTGVAIRAAAENPSRARTLGINTVGVTARIWVLVGLLSGAAGILTAFSQGAAGGTEQNVVVLPVRMLVLILAVAVVTVSFNWGIGRIERWLRPQ